MDFITAYFVVISVSFVAMVSPGPDFLIVMRNALGVNRKSGVMTALGVGCAILVHVTYCILGIAVVISQSIVLFNIVKYIGAAYLIWLGYKALRSSGWEMQAKQAKNKDKTLRKSFFEGFITNVFNPKATLFFLSLFTTVISPETPVTYQALYGVTAAIMAVGWFSFVSIALTQSTIRKMLSSVSIWIDRVTGLMFVLLGLKIATEKIN